MLGGRLERWQIIALIKLCIGVALFFAAIGLPQPWQFVIMFFGLLVIFLA